MQIMDGSGHTSLVVAEPGASVPDGATTVDFEEMQAKFDELVREGRSAMHKPPGSDSATKINELTPDVEGEVIMIAQLAGG